MKITITPEEIQGEILKDIHENDKLKKLTNLNPHSVWMLMVNAVGRVFSFFANRIISYVFDAIFPLTCDRYTLARHLAEEGLEFKNSEKSRVYLRIGCLSKPDMRYDIPQGTVVKTTGENGRAFEIITGGYVDQTTEQDYKGLYTIEVKAEAVLEGSIYNVAAETVTEFESSLDGIDVVFNPEESFGGADEETDEDARKRLIDAKQVKSRGIKTWFKVETEKLEGVRQAIVLPRYGGRGTVGILALGFGGHVSDETLQAIESRFNTDEEDPAGAFHVIAGRPKEFIQNYEVTVWYKKNTSPPFDTELNEVLINYIQNLAMGETQVLTVIAARLLGLGLMDVHISVPSGNVIVPWDALSKPGTVIWNKAEYDV